MRRQLSENDLPQRYNAEPQFALHARMIAFVPIENLDDAFDALSKQLANELMSTLNWFEDNYIARPGRNTRRSRPALIPPEILSMYQLTISGIQRTNNEAEAAHQRLKRTWRCPPLNLEVHRWSLLRPK